MIFAGHCMGSGSFFMGQDMGTDLVSFLKMYAIDLSQRVCPFGSTLDIFMKECYFKYSQYD